MYSGEFGASRGGVGSPSTSLRAGSGGPGSNLRPGGMAEAMPFPFWADGFLAGYGFAVKKHKVLRFIRDDILHCGSGSGTRTRVSALHFVTLLLEPGGGGRGLYEW
jgi:hypothetical protein